MYLLTSCTCVVMCKCMSMHHMYLHRCCTDVLCIEHFVPWQRYSALLLPALLHSIDAMPPAKASTTAHGSKQFTYIRTMVDS